MATFELTKKQSHAEITKAVEEGRCPDDPQTGEVYSCNSYRCPIHGERNLELAGYTPLQRRPS